MQKKRHLFLARATMTLLLALFTSVGAWATITGNGTQATRTLLTALTTGTHLPVG